MAEAPLRPLATGNRIQTRPKNADVHPGLIVQKRKRRSPAQKAADDAAAMEAADSAADNLAEKTKIAYRSIALAEQEIHDQDDANEATPRPSISTRETRARARTSLRSPLQSYGVRSETGDGECTEEPETGDESRGRPEDAEMYHQSDSVSEFEPMTTEEEQQKEGQELEEEDEGITTDIEEDVPPPKKAKRTKAPVIATQQASDRYNFDEEPIQPRAKKAAKISPRDAIDAERMELTSITSNSAQDATKSQVASKGSKQATMSK